MKTLILFISITLFFTEWYTIRKTSIKSFIPILAVLLISLPIWIILRFTFSCFSDYIHHPRLGTLFYRRRDKRILQPKRTNRRGTIFVKRFITKVRQIKHLSSSRVGTSWASNAPRKG